MEKERKERISKEACYADGGRFYDPTDLNEINDAVVRIQTVHNFATGIYVKVLSLKQNCLLTCAHVPITSKNTEITFMYQRKKRPLKLSLASSAELLRTDPKTFDFQLWTLSEESQNLIDARDIRPVLLENPTSEPQASDIIKVIQHPEGHLKRHSEKGISFIRDYSLGYNADTKFGSSGAAIVLGNELVGLHREANNEDSVNEGTLISAILHVIQNSLTTCPNPNCRVHIAHYFGKRKDGQPSGDGEIECHHCSVTYEGQFCDGEFDGIGICEFDDGGVVYKGRWKCGRPDGRGRVDIKNAEIVECVWGVEEKSGQNQCVEVGNGRIWEGKWTILVAGQGKLRFASGSVYEGDFVNGIATGQGQITWLDGRAYEGYFLNGKWSGRLAWPNGSVYEGEFLNDERTGQGKFIKPDGCVYEGEYLNDEPTGKGRLSWPDGRVYEGAFMDGQRTGKGKLTFPDGRVYEGDYLNGKPGGKGRFDWPDGRVYEGDFKDGERTGKGKVTFPDGQVYKGHFLNGESTGRGKVTILDSSVYEALPVRVVCRNHPGGHRDKLGPFRFFQSPFPAPEPELDESAICRTFLRKGICKRGRQNCSLAHPPQVKGGGQDAIKRAPRPQHCRNSSCARWKLGTCSFVHRDHSPRVQSPYDQSDEGKEALRTICVKNLGEHADEAVLATEFIDYGVECCMIVSFPNGLSKGYGFITLKSPKIAANLVAQRQIEVGRGRLLQLSWPTSQ